MYSTKSLLSFATALALGALSATSASARPAATPALDPLELQVLLDLSGFSPGEIDGKLGSNTERALAAYRGARGLWTRDRSRLLRHLRSEVGDPWTTYTVTAEDLAGPFEPLPDDMMERAKLAALGYEKAEEGIAERFHVSPGVLRKLNPTVEPGGLTAGTALKVPAVETVGSGASGANGASAVKITEVIVSRSRNSAEGRDARGRVVFFSPVSSGSERDPLPLGNWKVKGIAKDPTFAYNPDLFWDADKAHAKATLPAGPNNPVGRVWIDLDREHYGLHGTAEPSKVGHTQSHGCVRLTNWDALRLADAVSAGTPVRFVR